MPEPEKHGAGSQGVAHIRCRRTGQLYSLAECPRCPYCYGDDDAVASARREEYCDFDPKRDPVHFGFPPGAARDLRG